MKFNIDFYYTESFLPSKRHRRLRSRRVQGSVEVEIPELSDFPVAFIVHDYKSVYANAKSYKDFDGASGEYRMFQEEIRTYAGKLFMPVRITHGCAISLNFEPLDYIRRQLSDRDHWNYYENDLFSEESIVVESDIQEHIDRIQEKAKNFIIFDGKVWEVCEEPMYVIITFGLGHNHGGTGFFVEYHYNTNISKNNYFNALERDQAIAYGKKIAAGRGDTKSIEGMGDHDIIEVLMPEMVKRNPQKEHGDGDKFMNGLEELVVSSDSSMEAGLLVLMSLRNIRGEKE